MMKLTQAKERVIGGMGGLSGAVSVLGSWQVCHSLCLGIIAMLGVLGITVIGMPLLFLTKVAVYFWTAAFALLLVTAWIYARKRCVSEKLLMVNSGLIIAGVPFQSFQAVRPLLWLSGGVLIAGGAVLIMNDRLRRRKCCKAEQRK